MKQQMFQIKYLNLQLNNKLIKNVIDWQLNAKKLELLKQNKEMKLKALLLK